MGEESGFLSQTFQVLVPPLSSDVTLDKSQFPHMQNTTSSQGSYEAERGHRKQSIKGTISS